MVSADGRIEVVHNGRAGSGSLMQLVRRRDRLHRRDQDDAIATRWPPIRVGLVRHPVDRMVSAFFDICIDPEQRTTTAAGLAGCPDERDLSTMFDAFIDLVAEALSKPVTRCDPRLRPQVACLDGEVLDHIGRLEQFEHEVRVIEQLASIRLLPDDPWDHVQLNRSSARQSGFHPTALQQRKIRCLYEPDFVAWSYDDGPSLRGILPVRMTWPANGNSGIKMR